MKQYIYPLFSLLIIKICQAQNAPNPTILWHGMGDNCCHSFSMGAIKNIIQSEINNIHVHSLCLGSQIGDKSCSPTTDTETGFFGNSQEIVDYACWRLTSDEEFMAEVENSVDQKVNIIGFSQGGLFARVLAQQCQKLKFKNVISIGGPQNGIFGLPQCPQNTPNFLCESMRKMLNAGAYWSWIQNRSIQAQYWHDPLDSSAYLSSSIFLAKVNMENPKNIDDEKQVQKLQELENLVLVKFLKDEMVTPRESEWFWYYKNGQDEKVTEAKYLPIWKNLGLDKLDQDGRIVYKSVDGQHLQFSDEWFRSDVVEVFLK